MIDGIGMHGTDDGDIIHHLGGIGEKFGNPRADLPYCWNLKTDGAIGKRVWPDVIVVRRWPSRMESGRSLSNHSFISRLIVEGLHLRRSAEHMKIDGALRLRREVGQTGKTADSAGSLFFAQDFPHSRRRRAGRERQSELRRVARTLIRGTMRLFPSKTASTDDDARYLSPAHRRYFTNTSSRFSNSLATIVRAANFGSGSFGSAFDSPTFSNFSASSGLHRSTRGSRDRNARRHAALLRIKLSRHQTAGHVVDFPIDIFLRSGSRAFCANTRAASTNCGSFIVTNACSGVSVRSRRTVQTSREGALKMSIEAAARCASRSIEAAPVQALARIVFVETSIAHVHGYRFPDVGRLIRLHAGSPIVGVSRPLAVNA